MITLFLLGYILPLIFMFSICYFSDDVLTVRDLPSWWWAYGLPIINLDLMFIFIIGFFVDNVKTKSIKKWWNNFLDRKL